MISYLNKFYLDNLLLLSAQGPGLFEPIHGSAPDIAGQVNLGCSATFLLF